MKRKSPQKRLRSVSEGLQLFVPIGFVTVVVCATMPDRTCAERVRGAPIDYGQLILLTAKYLVTLEIIIKRTITLSTANAIRKEYGNQTPIIL